MKNKNMLKILVPMLFVANLSFGQVISGALKESGRKMTTELPFEIEGNVNGYISYELTVNIDGNVTSTRLMSNQTSVKSTPAKVKVRNHVNKMKFEKGYHYPKFHKVVVKITMKKPVIIEN